MPSPPKPWEKSSALPSSALDSSSSASPSSLSPSPSSATPPLRPPLPSTTPAYATAGYPSVSANRYGASTYGNAYGSGSYGSAYNSGYGSSYGSGSRYGPYGTYGGGYGSGYGGTYGSGYGGYSGGYGGGYGGYNRPGGYGRPLGARDEFSLTQAMERNTAGAFHMLDQIVGAFGGFAQMLDSTFHATHSSFMAMVGVVERFGHLRNYLGQVLSMFTLLRFCKNVLRRAIGLKPVAQTQELTAGEFSKFENQPPRPSKRPFFIFLLIVVGIPYLMRRIMKSAERRRLSQPGLLENGQPIATKDSPVLDPSRLEFARALFDFAGENFMELHLRRGDILAILSKTDAFGAPSQWWRARLKSGGQGLVPSNYLEILEKKTPPLPQANPDPTAI